MRITAGVIFYLLVLLLALWAIGLSFGVAGNLVHVLLLFVALLVGVELLQRARNLTERDTV